MKECEVCGVKLPDSYDDDLCPECREEQQDIDDDTFLSVLNTNSIPPNM